MTKRREWPNRHPKRKRKRKNAMCLMCTHFYLGSFEAGYGDGEDDTPMRLECIKMHWNADEDAHDAAVFRQIMRTAEECSDYHKVKI